MEVINLVIREHLNGMLNKLNKIEEGEIGKTINIDNIKEDYEVNIIIRKNNLNKIREE